MGLPKSSKAQEHSHTESCVPSAGTCLTKLCLPLLYFHNVMRDWFRTKFGWATLAKHIGYLGLSFQHIRGTFVQFGCGVGMTRENLILLK